MARESNKFKKLIGVIKEIGLEMSNANNGSKQNLELSKAIMFFLICHFNKFKRVIRSSLFYYSDF